MCEKYRWEITPHPCGDYDTLVTNDDDVARDAIAEIADSYMWEQHEGGERIMRVLLNCDVVEIKETDNAIRNQQADLIESQALLFGKAEAQISEYKKDAENWRSMKSAMQSFYARGGAHIEVRRLYSGVVYAQRQILPEHEFSYAGEIVGEMFREINAAIAKVKE